MKSFIKNLFLAAVLVSSSVEASNTPVCGDDRVLETVKKLYKDSDGMYQLKKQVQTIAAQPKASPTLTDYLANMTMEFNFDVNGVDSSDYRQCEGSIVITGEYSKLYTGKLWLNKANIVYVIFKSDEGNIRVKLDQVSGSKTNIIFLTSVYNRDMFKTGTDINTGEVRPLEINLNVEENAIPDAMLNGR